MRILTVLILSLFTATIYSQDVFTGKVLDGATEQGLPYVNIGVVGKNIGTVSGSNGKFKLVLPEKYNGDTVRVSFIGYKALTFKVSEFKSLILKEGEIQLEEEVNKLQEIVVSDRELQAKVLGNKTRSKSISSGFTSNLLGNEMGIKIRVKRKPTFIENVNLSIAMNLYDTLKFRVNFYHVEKGKPGKSMLSENIIVTTQIKEGVLTVDLSEYNIVAYNDFVVTLEWIEDIGEGGLHFSAGFFNSPIFVRKTSQADWTKVGLIGIGLNVDVKH